jgi:hypothetical protein
VTATDELPGKIFISHSWHDKAFVRRLAQRLSKHGFAVWLDEQELKPGDRLAETIAAVLSKCHVVLVVVSKASRRSRWLSYELSLATKRMIAGRCRVIPVVIGDAEPPLSVRDVLYADFRRSFRAGIGAVITALQYEKEKLKVVARKRRAIPSAPQEVIEVVFGNRGWASRFGDMSDRRKHWDVVYVPVADEDGNNYRVVIDRVRADVNVVEQPPLRDGWWMDYTHETEYIDEPLRLIVSDRPVRITETARCDSEGRVLYRTFDLPFIGIDRAHVTFADVSGLNRSKQIRVLRAARKELILAGRRLRASA